MNTSARSLITATKKLVIFIMGFFSFKSKFNLFVDQEINTFNDSNINKINEISYELNLLISITESIFHSMLTCRNEQNFNATENIFPQDFFKLNKVTKLH